MASILSQYEVYFHLHEPFIFSWHLPSSSVSRLFLCVFCIGCQMHMVAQHTLFIKCIASSLLNYQLAIVRRLIKHVTTERYAQLLAHYYTTPSIQLSIGKLSLWIKIKQLKGFETMHQPCPACVHTVYGKGAWSLHISIKNHDTHTETGKIIYTYKALTLHGKQLLLKHDQLRSHKNTVQPCLLIHTASIDSVPRSSSLQLQLPNQIASY